MVKDPICGMEVDPKKAKYMLKKNGADNYFCSKHCFEQFKNGDQSAKSSEKTEDTENKTTILIKGMSCSSCVARIEKSLKKQ